MRVTIVFETHSLSEDNERGIASGWLPGRLSQRGRALAPELGVRHRSEHLAAVFTSDLRRAVETAELAFAEDDLPILADWRLRECDYGALNGAAAAQVLRESRGHLATPYPGGESWGAGNPPGRTVPARPAASLERTTRSRRRPCRDSLGARSLPQWRAPRPPPRRRIRVATRLGVRAQ